MFKSDFLTVIVVWQNLTGIKGLSEAKVDKICEAAEKIVNFGYITGSDAITRLPTNMHGGNGKIVYARAFTYEHQYNLLLGLAAKMAEEPFRLLVKTSVLFFFFFLNKGLGDISSSEANDVGNKSHPQSRRRGVCHTLGTHRPSPYYYFINNIKKKIQPKEGGDINLTQKARKKVKRK
ncbi:putative DNA recombination/repair protein RadA [Rosa chinensis]|uniref:Putative DNA recombination/repair protein RadA n=1 Tax=Rosa chinensis TaxID=74649 RepID=A0A2P6QQZ4_ROSCH|nr:putative DNA recombination/repair protein RadA [Rosa chinensis]